MTCSDCIASFPVVNNLAERVGPKATFRLVAIDRDEAGEHLVHLLLGERDVGRAWPAALAAIFIGVVSYTAAGWFRVPPLVVVVAAIVPLLPGLSIYRGLSLLAADNYTGILGMITAIAIAISLAAGVILGEYVAQPLRHEARRLEGRLSGPRLVGPLRARARRRR